MIPERGVSGQHYSHEFPAGWTVSTADGGRESFALSESQSPTTDPQAGRQKGKGRVCLGKKGTVRRRRGERSRTGRISLPALVRAGVGGATETNSIRWRQGICK